LASPEFAHWLLTLHAIIDAEQPGYARDPDRWRPYFNADYLPREALAADMSKQTSPAH
jgi:hypothetical protein